MTSLYTLALFAHLAGVVGVFAGMGAFTFGVFALRRAERVEQVRMLTALLTVSGNVVAGSVVVLGLGGFTMAILFGLVREPWLIVATVSFILLAPLGMLGVSSRVEAIARIAKPMDGGLLPESLAARARDPLLAPALSVYLSCLLGIVYVMTSKPGLEQSIVAMLIAIGVGLAAGCVLWWIARVRRHRTGVMPA